MALLGGWRQQTSMPGHLGGYVNPATDWVSWYCRAVDRSFGLPRGTLNRERLQQIQVAFCVLLSRQQINYHTASTSRNVSASHRLHRLANGLFAAIFVSCLLQLGLSIFHIELLLLRYLLVGLNAFLPALAGALTGISNQGEFQRVAHRSEAMRDILGWQNRTDTPCRFGASCHSAEHTGYCGEGGLCRRLSAIEPENNALKSVAMRQVIEQIATLMFNETLEWRIVFQDRPPDFPA
jgi:hypothetical protein